MPATTLSFPLAAFQRLMVAGPYAPLVVTDVGGVSIVTDRRVPPDTAYVLNGTVHVATITGLTDG